MQMPGEINWGPGGNSIRKTFTSVGAPISTSEISAFVSGEVMAGATAAEVASIETNASLWIKHGVFIMWFNIILFSP